jgi:hypothetical protein
MICKPVKTNNGLGGYLDKKKWWAMNDGGAFSSIWTLGLGEKREGGTKVLI